MDKLKKHAINESVVWLSLQRNTHIYLKKKVDRLLKKDWYIIETEYEDGKGLK